MTRVIRPLIYILGFSVFCACTTTRAIPQDELEPSGVERDFVVYLTDGTGLELHATTVDSDELEGLIAPKDSAMFSRYVVSNGLVDTNGEVLVTIPRDDIVEVKSASSSVALSMALGFFAVVGFLGVLFFKGGDCSGLC